ncbi:STE20-like serine threonine [Brachionus plicatilis]|uniref:STE20-like serine threonine n=1 Tax=Brachionus plicatilis TaxID=10195 RepID=A0A3M7SGV8_BRAPC|nr:STE20-like serine threonine [Brachionus plicatilis]
MENPLKGIRQKFKFFLKSKKPNFARVKWNQGRLSSVSSESSASLNTSSSKPKTLDTSYPFLIQNINPEDRWEVLNEIGDGGFSKVYRVRNRQTDQIAAAKIISKCEPDDIHEHVIEVEILRNSKHINIIEFYEAFYFRKKLWVNQNIFCSIIIIFWSNPGGKKRPKAIVAFFSQKKNIINCKNLSQSILNQNDHWFFY